jgi:YggT family protein
MLFAYAIQFVDLLVKALTGAILLRIVFSWFDPTGNSGITRFLTEITEPIIAPLRRVVPSVGMLDLSPMVASILVQLVGNILIDVLIRAAYAS